MYDDHYGLSGRPFQLTPDPRFWFETATHRKAMAYLGYGLSQGEGFIVITGDVGAGKTTLVGHLMATVDRERLHAIKIVSTQIEADDLLRLVAGGLDVDSDGLSKAQLLTAIERGLHGMARAGRRTLLVVDEAQALPIASLEELRMLSNFQAGGHALLQIFLLGQPEFRERLHGSDRLEQLRQRIIAMHHLDPMGPDEVEPYMKHRLSLVGWQGNPEFTPDAFAALYTGSDGVPRRLNQLAGRVMLYGAIEQVSRIDGHVVAAVIADISGDAPETMLTPKPMPMPMPMPVADEMSGARSHCSVDPLPARVPSEVAAEEVTPRPFAPRKKPAWLEPDPVAPAAAEAAPLPVIAPTLAPTVAPVVPPPAPLPAPPSPPPAPPLSEAAPTEADLNARIGALETRIEEQESALRRVLTLLVDWVEGGGALAGSIDMAAMRAASGN